MSFKRTSIPFFELANAAYASSTVTFFQVDDTTNLKLATLITLYADKTSSTTYPNPYSLDSDGKFSAPVYAIERTIAVVNDINGLQHDTGIWEPALTAADVAAAAASATAAAASEVLAAADATSASVSAVSAAASAVLAMSAAGGFYVTTTDTTPQNANAKLTVSGLLTKTVVGAPGVATLAFAVPAASDAQATTLSSVTTAVTPGNLAAMRATDVQAIAKAESGRYLTPANLAALGADTVTTGLSRLATLAETYARASSVIAVTPVGLGNVVNTLIGNFTNVSSGANVTMTAGLRYRFTATIAATVNLPTTFGAAVGDYNIVEFACTTAATMTVGRGGASIDGNAANDTSIRYGDVVLYHATAVGTVRSIQIGILPVT